MKTSSKILSTAIGAVIEFRTLKLFTFLEKTDRLSSEAIEYENLMFNAETLELLGKSREADAVRTVAQSKLETLAIDYKLAVFESKFAAFGWIMRRPFITKNPRYESIREYLEDK